LRERQRLQNKVHNMVAITFDGVDPTLFNFVSDAIAVGSRWVLGFALSYLYVFIMTWQVKAGKKPVPVSALGDIPADFFGAARLVRVLSWSSPALVFALLFLAADFSHTIADLGLSFVTVQMEGPSDTVLDLTNRNSLRLIQTTGDPNRVRSSYIPASAFEGDVAGAGVEADLITYFLNAADLVARGASPFVNDKSEFHHSVGNAVWGGVSNTSVRYHLDNSPLTEMDLELPLNCTQSELVQIDQSLGFLPELDESVFSLVNESQYAFDFKTTAKVPSCAFDSLRLTGIFGGSRETASVDEVASIVFVNFGDQVFLTKGEERFQNITFTPKMKRLSRDRMDWHTGREVSAAVDGVVIGNLDIRFGAVVLAAGPEGIALPTGILDPPWNRRTDYMLVGEILGDCPERPSGFSSAGISCVSLIQMQCFSFHEDFQSLPLNDQFLVDSDCIWEEVSVIWGRNFVADAELVAVLAGVYGQVKPDPTGDLSALRQFDFHGVFSAMFVLSSLSTRPTLVEVVSPRINGIYIGFMLLPFVLVLLVLAVAVSAHRSRLPIPQKPWELMVFGRNEEKIPQKDEKTGQYPKLKESLRLCLEKDSTGRSSKLAVVNSLGTTEDDIAVAAESGDSASGLEEQTQIPPVSTVSLDKARPVTPPSKKVPLDPSGIWSHDSRAQL